jgi:catechol 2,3-dioxygenase-like lactoylglutathione lyase family enzyme
MGMTAAKNCVDIGIVVGDIKKSLTFYVDLLGLKKIEEMPLWFGTMHRLGFGDSFVKLIDPKKVPPAGTIGLEHALGFRYLTFQISNIDEVYAACEKAGVEVELSKRELAPKLKIAMVRDPDGNVVEFVQRG